MTDKELLELAADAYGIKRLDWINGSGCFYYDDEETGRECWNPLDDDGQAFRLAVKLEMLVEIYGNTVRTITKCDGCEVYQTGNDIFKLTRRAIVRAAAEIGKNM